jgi:GH24 family phage-related lysozyme (muramidase)
MSMKIIITESQLNFLTEAASLADDSNFQAMVKGWEGRVVDPKTKLHVTYDDETMSPVSSSKQLRGTMTIGYGTTKSVYPNMKPGEKIPETKALNLLKMGIVEKENEVRDLIPKYDTLPKYVRAALVNAKYRGDLGNKTIGLINKGKWDQVSKEYLDHPNYTNPGKLTGVVSRMKSNSEAFDKYAKEISPKKTIKTNKNNGDDDNEDFDTWYRKYMFNRVLYPTKRSKSDFVNLRDEPEVNNGFIDNKIGEVKWPNPVGVVKGIKRVDNLNTWFWVKLDPSVDAEDENAWVHGHYVTTDKNAKYV